MSKKSKTTLIATTDPKDKLYALVNDEENSLCYILAPNAMELWNRIIELEWFGTGMTQEMLRTRGWVARPVRVRVFKKQPKNQCFNCSMAMP